MTEPYVSEPFAGDHRLLATIREVLPRGETVHGVFGITKISPNLSVLVVTDLRLRAGHHESFVEQGWPVDLALEDVAEVRVTGFMDDVRLVRHDGTGVKVGNLAVEDEIVGQLARVVERARHGGRPTPGPPGPTYEVYRP